MRDVFAFLWRELAPHRRTVILAAIFSFAAAGLDLLAPIALGRSFDRASVHAPFLWYGGAVAVWFLTRLIANGFRSYIGYLGEKIGALAAERWYLRSLGTLLHFPLDFHYGKKKQESSEHLNRMQWEMSNMISSSLFDLFPALIAMAAIIGYLSYIDLRIGSVVGGAIGLLIVHGTYMAPRTDALLKKTSKIREGVSSFGWDALRNILVVKSTTNERYVERMLAKNENKFLRSEVDFLGFFWGKLIAVRDAVVIIASALAVGIAVDNYATDRFTLGQLTTVTAYTFSMFGFVKYMEWHFRTMTRFSTSYRRFVGLMRVEPEDYTSGSDTTIAGNIEYRKVRFRYREDKSTLEDISFTARAGTKVAIVGESGEGKTTLADLLGRYYLPQSGKIFIDGVDLKKIKLHSLRSQMAYVPQDLTLFHETIGFNIRYGRPDAGDADIRKAARMARLDEFIESLPEKYKTMVGERGLKLSGGERQRVALARAFLRDPRILILDEPTAHLDSKTENLIQDSLRELMAGRTTFVIAHRLRTVAEADVILVLKDGRIAESGTHAELVERGGVYAELLRAQRHHILEQGN